MPDHVLSNHDLTQNLETTDEWIRTRTGIRERRVLAEGESLVDLAERAARAALEDAGEEGGAPDLVIVATMTAERSPSTASRLAGRLGLSAAAFDISAACAGFTTALALADQSIRSGAARRVLVVGAEAMSRFLDWTDRSTAILMADGAGAVVVDAAQSPGIGPVTWGSAPELGDAIRIERPDERFAMSGPAILRWTRTHLPRLAREAISRSGLQPSSLSALVPHQANARVIESLAIELGIDAARVSFDLETSGNTSAASIPIALDRMRRTGPLSAGGPTLLIGFGGGLSWCGLVADLPPVREPSEGR